MGSKTKIFKNMFIAKLSDDISVKVEANPEYSVVWMWKCIIFTPKWEDVV